MLTEAQSKRLEEVRSEFKQNIFYQTDLYQRLYILADAEQREHYFNIPANNRVWQALHKIMNVFATKQKLSVEDQQCLIKTLQEQSSQVPYAKLLLANAYANNVFFTDQAQYIQLAKKLYEEIINNDEIEKTLRGSAYYHLAILSDRYALVDPMAIHSYIKEAIGYGIADAKLLEIDLAYYWPQKMPGHQVSKVYFDLREESPIAASRVAILLQAEIEFIAQQLQLVDHAESKLIRAKKTQASFMATRIKLEEQVNQLAQVNETYSINKEKERLDKAVQDASEAYENARGKSYYLLATLKLKLPEKLVGSLATNELPGDREIFLDNLETIRKLNTILNFFQDCVSENAAQRLQSLGLSHGVMIYSINAFAEAVEKKLDTNDLEKLIDENAFYQKASLVLQELATPENIVKVTEQKEMLESKQQMLIEKYEHLITLQPVTEFDLTVDQELEKIRSNLKEAFDQSRNTALLYAIPEAYTSQAAACLKSRDYQNAVIFFLGAERLGQKSIHLQDDFKGLLEEKTFLKVVPIDNFMELFVFLNKEKQISFADSLSILISYAKNTSNNENSKKLLFILYALIETLYQRNPNQKLSNICTTIEDKGALIILRNSAYTAIGQSIPSVQPTVTGVGNLLRHRVNLSGEKFDELLAVFSDPDQSDLEKQEVFFNKLRAGLFMPQQSKPVVSPRPMPV